MGYDEKDTCWHLLIQTEGGTVSILKNLDAPTARQAYRQLAPFYEHPINNSSGWGLRQIHATETKSISILGPEGADLDPWRGVDRSPPAFSPVS